MNGVRVCVTLFGCRCCVCGGHRAAAVVSIWANVYVCTCTLQTHWATFHINL